MDNLAKLAIAGTSRLPNAAIRSDLPIDPLIDTLTVDGVERRLLLAAGAAAVYRDAGCAAGSTSRSPGVAAAELRRPCSKKLGQLLVDLADAKDADLLIEAASLLDQGGLRVPHDVLPVLLQASDEKVRGAMRSVVGERGRWLASCNPDWTWVLDKTDGPPPGPSEIETVWNEGTLAERVTALSRMHAVQPMLARDRLQAVWAKEKAEPRTQLLAAFDASLSPDDEPFLEDILDDRSAAVRARAARLLARLPGSRLSKRMLERADAMLRYEPPKSGGMLSKLKSLVGSDAGRLIANPPEDIGADWERDGIPAKAPQGVGKRAFWLAEVISAMPLRHWEARFACTPGVMIATARGSEWIECLLQGWTRSASNEAAPDWLLPLWDRWIEFIEQLPAAERLGSLRWLEPLLSMMPKQQSEACAEQMLKTSSNWAFYPLMRHLTRPWGRRLAEAVLLHLRRAAGDRQIREVMSMNLVPSIAYAIPAELYDQARGLAALASKEDEGDETTARGYADRSWKAAIAKFDEIIRIREMLTQEIAS